MVRMTLRPEGDMRLYPLRITEASSVGWALNLLSEDNLSFASTAQTIGLNTGFFLSFTVFLALNSPDFA